MAIQKPIKTLKFIDEAKTVNKPEERVGDVWRWSVQSSE